MKQKSRRRKRVQCKLGEVLMTEEVARRLREEEISRSDKKGKKLTSKILYKGDLSGKRRRGNKRKITDDNDVAGPSSRDEIHFAISGGEETGEAIRFGNCVQIVIEPFKEDYAIVLGESYGDEYEIQYFEKNFENWVLNPMDKDSRTVDELKKVKATVDNDLRYTFNI